MSKMKKDYRLINDCDKCSHCFRKKYISNNTETCCKCDFNNEDRDIDVMYGIPKWCPLEDAK